MKHLTLKPWGVVGLNEHTIGLIREHLTKKTGFQDVSDRENVEVLAGSITV